MSRRISFGAALLAAILTNGIAEAAAPHGGGHGGGGFSGGGVHGGGFSGGGFSGGGFRGGGGGGGVRVGGGGGGFNMGGGGVRVGGGVSSMPRSGSLGGIHVGNSGGSTFRGGGSGSGIRIDGGAAVRSSTGGALNHTFSRGSVSTPNFVERNFSKPVLSGATGLNGVQTRIAPNFANSSGGQAIQRANLGSKLQPWHGQTPAGVSPSAAHPAAHPAMSANFSQHWQSAWNRHSNTWGQRSYFFGYRSPFYVYLSRPRIGFGYGYPWFGYGYGYGYGYPYYGYGFGYPSFAYQPACSYYGYGYASSAPTSGIAPAYVADEESMPDEMAASLDYASRGEQAFRDGRYKDAIQLWRHALVDDPQNGAYVMLLSAALFADGQYDEAAGAIQYATQLLPQDEWGTVVAHYPELYGDFQNYVGHLRALEQKTRENPDSPALRFLLGWHYGYRGYAKEAVGQLDRAIALAPKDEVAVKVRELFAAKLEAAGGAAPAPPASVPASPPAKESTPPAPSPSASEG